MKLRHTKCPCNRTKFATPNDPSLAVSLRQMSFTLARDIVTSAKSSLLAATGVRVRQNYAYPTISLLTDGQIQSVPDNIAGLGGAIYAYQQVERQQS